MLPWLLPMVMMVLLYSTVPVSAIIRTISSNTCERTVGAEMKYYACTSDPSHILKPGNSRYNLTVSPADHTCGTTNPKEVYCDLVSVAY